MDRDAPAWRKGRAAPGVGRAGDRGDGRGASSSSGPTAASSEASKSKGSGFFGTSFARPGAPAGTSGGSGAATSASAARAEAPAEKSDPAPPRRVTLRVGAGAGDGAGSGGAEGFSALTGTPDCLRPLPLRSYILDRKPMAAAGEVARRTTSRRFQTRGRNAARDATTNPPRRGSLGGRATSARAFPTIACARASLAPPSVADARRALSSTPSGAGAGALYPPQPRPPEPDNDDFELLGELLVRPRPAHQEKGGTERDARRSMRGDARDAFSGDAPASTPGGCRAAMLSQMRDAGVGGARISRLRARTPRERNRRPATGASSRNAGPGGNPPGPANCR